MNLDEVAKTIVKCVEKGTYKSDFETCLSKIPEPDLMRYKKRLEDLGVCKKTNSMKDFHNELYYSVPDKYKQTPPTKGFNKRLTLTNVMLCTDDKYGMAIPKSNVNTYSGTVYDIEKIFVSGHKMERIKGKTEIKDINSMNVLSHNGIIAVYDGVKYMYNVKGNFIVSDELPSDADFLTIFDIYSFVMHVLIDKMDRSCITLGDDADISFEPVEGFTEISPNFYVNMSGLHEEFTHMNFKKLVDNIKSIAYTLFGKQAKAILNNIHFIMPELYNLQPDIDDDFCYYYK